MKFHHAFIFVSCLVASLSGAQAPANASPVLPPPTSSVDVTAIVATNPNMSQEVVEPFNASLLSASGSVSISPFANIQSQVSDVGSGVGGSGAISTLTYFFSVVGGNVGDAVKVDVATSLSATASSDLFFGLAKIDVGGTNNERAVCTDSQCASTQFNGIINLTANSGTAVMVQILVEANGNSLAVGSASASADPFIFIDPTDPNASEYAIIVSDGVGNALATTPLPATLPLFSTGLGALGLLGWRRKRKASTAVLAA